MSEHRAFVGNKEIMEFYIGNQSIDELWCGNKMIWNKLRYPYAYVSLKLSKVQPDGFDYMIDEYGLGLEFDENCIINKVGANIVDTGGVIPLYLAFNVSNVSWVRWGSFQAMSGTVRNKYVAPYNVANEKYVYLGFDNVDKNGNYLVNYFQSYSSKNLRVFHNNLNGMLKWVKE